MNTSTFDKIAAMMIANDPNVNNYIDGSIIFKPTTQPSTQQQAPVGKVFDYNYKIPYEKLKAVIPASKFNSLFIKIEDLLNNYRISKDVLDTVLTKSSDKMKGLILLIEKRFRNENLIYGTPEFDLNIWEENRNYLSTLLHAELKKIYPNLPALEKIQTVAKRQASVTEEEPDGQTGEGTTENPVPEERNIIVNQYTFTIKPDGKIYYGNGKELTEQTIKNKVYIRKELQDGTLRVSTFDKKNYYVLSDNRIIDSGKTVGDESVLNSLTKERILEAASLYKKSC
jgi:hypothetical protein